MATFSIDDLTTPMTREDVQSSIYKALEILGVRTTVWKSGSVVRSLIVAVSIVIASFSQLTAKIARSGFLELSSGEWLRLVAHYVYGVDYFEATFASGAVTLTNTGGGVYVLAAGDLVLTNPDTGKAYRNTSPFTLGAMTTLDVGVSAVEVGSDSSAPPGTITLLSTPLLGVTCTNALWLLGRDDESDTALRARCYEKLGALSPMGPWDAYAFAVRNAVRADGTSIGITRIRIVKDGFGNVTTYVATDSGGVTGTVGDLSTDLGAADEAIQQWAAPLSVTAFTESATPLTVHVTYEVWLYNTSGNTDADVQALVSARIADFMAAQPIGGNVIDGLTGGHVFVSAIEAAIGGVLPQIFRVVVSVPASDPSVATSEVPVTDTPTCIKVHQVAPPEGFGA